jgi:hypothetical protein
MSHFICSFTLAFAPSHSAFIDNSPIGKQATSVGQTFLFSPMARFSALLTKGWSHTIGAEKPMGACVWSRPSFERFASLSQRVALPQTCCATRGRGD